MKQLTILMLLIATFTGFGQTDKFTRYTAANGVTYHIGDTIWLNKGSMLDGSFKFLKQGGANDIIPFSDPKINYRNLQENGFIISKIKQHKKRYDNEVYFVRVDMDDDASTLHLVIDPAIEFCEVKPCDEKNETAATASKYDELLKLKELLDAGAITDEEYKKEKEKLLSL